MRSREAARALMMHLRQAVGAAALGKIKEPVRKKSQVNFNQLEKLYRTQRKRVMVGSLFAGRETC